MIQITYKHGIVDTFEIYGETNTHIMWKDYAQNLIRINKHTGRITLLHNDEWIDHDIDVDSYNVI